MRRADLGFVLTAIVLAPLDQPSFADHTDARMQSQQRISDPFALVSLNHWRIPRRVSEFSIVKLAPKVDEIEPHFLKTSWAIPPGVAPIIVPPGKETRCAMSARLGSCEDETFELASGEKRTLDLSSAPARDGGGIGFSVKINTGTRPKMLVFLQERVQTLDAKGNVIYTWYAKSISYQVLESKK